VDRWLATVGLPNGIGGVGRIVEHGTDLITDAFTVTITGAGVGAGALDGSQWTDTGNRTYTINDAHGVLGAGTHDLNMESVSTGLGTNLESGTTLTIVTPIANCNNTGTLAKDLTGAADRETVAEGLRRLLKFWRNPPISGNVADWVRVIEAVQAGSLKAYVWPKREQQPNGYGRTDYCALKTGETGSDAHIGSSDDLYADITAAVTAELPVLLARNSRQLTLVAVPTDLDLTITLSDDAAAGQKCDWDSETAHVAAPILVASHDAGGAPNKEIVADRVVAAASRTDGMLAGDRVVIGGIEATVDKAGVVDGLANDSTFRLTYWPYATGAGALNGLNICSGGGLIGHIDQTDANGDDWDRSGVNGTIQTHFNDFGPGKGTYAAGAQIDGWEDTLRLLGIQSDVVQFGDGAIVDVTVDAPGADVPPTAGSGTTTERLTLDEPTVHQVFV
jgi:hypothetical protein